MPEGLNSDLNLNVGAPPRVRPGMGEWGPQEVPTTRQKRRMRWWTLLALLGVLAAVVGYGYWMVLTRAAPAGEEHTRLR